MKRSFILMTLLALFGLQHPTSATIIKKLPHLTFLVGRYEKIPSYKYYYMARTSRQVM